jgi:hypothetical protein
MSQNGGSSGAHSPHRSGEPQPPQPPYRLYDHAIERMIERGYTLPDVDAALRNVARVIVQSNGNVVFVGRGNGIGVVVDPDTDDIVSVLRPGMVPE